MRRLALAAAAAVGLFFAGQASAAVYDYTFSASGPWSELPGFTGSPFGLPASPTVSGSFTLDSSLWNPLDPIGSGPGTVTALSYTTGTKTWTTAEIDPGSTFIAFPTGLNPIVQIGFDTFNVFSPNNTVSISDGIGGIYCNGCVNSSFTVTGAVPEPASWALMLLGFFGLGAMVRRRRSLAAA